MANRRFDEDANDTDVVVIGAGVTGLTAAYEILRRRPGLQVLLVEGKHGAGGRVPPGDRADAFHAHPLQEHVSRLLRTLGIPTEPRLPIGRDHRTIFAEGRPITGLPPFHAAQANHFLRSLQAATGTSSDRWEVGEDEEAASSVARLLARLVFFSRPRSVCGAILRNACGTDDLQQTSALWLFALLRAAGGLLDRLRATLGDEKRYFVRGGARRIVEELHRRIILNGGSMKFGEPVNKIQFNDDRAYVFTDENRFKCEYVVIAVPPPQSSRIVVEPPLADRLRDSLAAFSRGENAFFHATYERRFWSEDRARSGDVLAAPDSGTVVRSVYDATTSAATLAGFLAECDPDSPGAELQLFDTLRRCFETEEAYRWRRYEETPRAGTPMNVPRIWLLPESHVNTFSHGRLFFAASEHAASWPGTVDGAIEAGTNAALLILALTRPQTLARTGALGANGRSARGGTTFRTTVLHRFLLALNILLLVKFTRAALTPSL